MLTQNPRERGQGRSAAERDAPCRVGDSNAEGPPVPIPNTEVKLCCAEDTCPATDRENRSLPTQKRRLGCEEHRRRLLFSQLNKLAFALIAQSVERRTVNPCVLGSSPSWGAKASGLNRSGAENRRFSPVFSFFLRFSRFFENRKKRKTKRCI